MKYQLVLQFSSDLLEEQGGAKALEHELNKTLGEDVYLDGYEKSEVETSFFIFTPDPCATFERIREILARRELLDAVVAAHRPFESDSYTVIWPENTKRVFRIG